MAAAVVAASAVAAGIVGPWLHRRSAAGATIQRGDISTPLDPVEAKRVTGPSYFRSPGA